MGKEAGGRWAEPTGPAGEGANGRAARIAVPSTLSIVSGPPVVNPGFRIFPMPQRPSRALVAALAEMVTPHLSDNMSRLCGAAAALRPMHRDGKLAGPAFTVRVAAGDNLMVHKAIDLAEPGDVLVIDAGGALEQAIIGEIMASWAASAVSRAS